MTKTESNVRQHKQSFLRGAKMVVANARKWWNIPSDDSGHSLDDWLKALEEWAEDASVFTEMPLFPGEADAEAEAPKQVWDRLRDAFQEAKASIVLKDWMISEEYGPQVLPENNAGDWRKIPLNWQECVCETVVTLPDGRYLALSAIASVDEMERFTRKELMIRMSERKDSSRLKLKEELDKLEEKA